MKNPLFNRSSPSSTFSSFYKSIEWKESLSIETIDAFFDWLKEESFSALCLDIQSHKLHFPSLTQIFLHFNQSQEFFPPLTLEERYIYFSQFWKSLLESIIERYQQTKFFSSMIEHLVNSQREAPELVECKCSLLEQLMLVYSSQPKLFEEDNFFENEIRTFLWQRDFSTLEEICKYVPHVDAAWSFLPFIIDLEKSKSIHETTNSHVMELINASSSLKYLEVKEKDLIVNLSMHSQIDQIVLKSFLKTHIHLNYLILYFSFESDYLALFPKLPSPFYTYWVSSKLNKMIDF